MTPMLVLPFLQQAADTTGAYGHFPGIGGRGAVWIAAEVHLMFAAFVLGVPMFAVITELIGIVGKDSKYDKVYSCGQPGLRDVNPRIGCDPQWLPIGFASDTKND